MKTTPRLQLRQLELALVLALVTMTFTSRSAWAQTVVGWGLSPAADPPPDLTNVVAIAAGSAHSLALLSDGRVRAWGDNSNGQCAVPGDLTNAVAIAGGDRHSVALRADGTVVAWGDLWFGAVPEGLSNVVALATGGPHILAVDDTGHVTAWGLNFHGQTDVPAGLEDAVTVAAGTYHSLALTADGVVVAWGQNASGQATVPASLTNAVAIAAGTEHSLALKADGTLVAWGENQYGQCDIPAGTENARAIATGGIHGLALLGDGAPFVTRYPLSRTVAEDPRLASATHLSADSPCIGAGSAAYSRGVDIDDEPWLTPPSMGADEYGSAGAMGPLAVALSASYTNVATGFPVDFTARIDGHTASNEWDFGDGNFENNRLEASHSWSTPGRYTVSVTGYNDSFSEGVKATVTVEVRAEVQYVNAANATPAHPYSTWETAAVTIQEAIESSSAGGLVLVTNGVYETGGSAVAGAGALTNRVALTKPVLVRSVNGPEVTVIRGSGPLGPKAARCAYVGTDAVLSGFTLTEGHTLITGDDGTGRSGGGV